jgi:hypothetical protein
VLQPIPILLGFPIHELSGRFHEKRSGIRTNPCGSDHDHIGNYVLECSDVHEGQGICVTREKAFCKHFCAMLCSSKHPSSQNEIKWICGLSGFYLISCSRLEVYIFRIMILRAE